MTGTLERLGQMPTNCGSPVWLPSENARRAAGDRPQIIVTSAVRRLQKKKRVRRCVRRPPAARPGAGRDQGSESRRAARARVREAGAGGGAARARMTSPWLSLRDRRANASRAARWVLASRPLGSRTGRSAATSSSSSKRAAGAMTSSGGSPKTFARPPARRPASRGATCSTCADSRRYGPTLRRCRRCLHESAGRTTRCCWTRSRISPTSTAGMRRRPPTRAPSPGASPASAEPTSMLLDEPGDLLLVPPPAQLGADVRIPGSSPARRASP